MGILPISPVIKINNNRQQESPIYKNKKQNNKQKNDEFESKNFDEWLELFRGKY